MGRYLQPQGAVQVESFVISAFIPRAAGLGYVYGQTSGPMGYHYSAASYLNKIGPLGYYLTTTDAYEDARGPAIKWGNIRASFTAVSYSFIASLASPISIMDGITVNANGSISISTETTYTTSAGIVTPGPCSIAVQMVSPTGSSSRDIEVWYNGRLVGSATGYSYYGNDSYIAKWSTFRSYGTPVHGPNSGMVFLTAICSGLMAKALSANPLQIFRRQTNVALLKPSGAAGASLAVAATTAPVVGSQAFKSQPVFAVNALTAPVVGAMSFGPASRVAVNASTASVVGSQAFKSQPVLTVAATTGQTIGSQAFKSQPVFAVNALTAAVVGAMSFGPSARVAINATTGATVGNMAFATQARFAVAAQTAPTVGAMSFGPSSRLAVSGQTAPVVGSQAFKSQPVFAVAAQLAPAVGSMTFAPSPRFSVAALLASTTGSMAFLSGQVPSVPGELCLTPRARGRISGNMRKTGTITFEVRPL